MDDNPMMVTKSVLRKKLMAVINNLPESEIFRQSEIVTKKVTENAEFVRAKVVSIYLSTDNEIQTENILKEIYRRGKECFIPRFQAGSCDMEMIRLSSMEEYYKLPKNKWNIRQHPEYESIESIFDRGDLDLVICPGLGFTLSGNRLGRGKGYYDKFFKKCEKELSRFPYTIGLSFKEQILPELPIEPHDFPLHLIITP